MAVKKFRVIVAFDRYSVGAIIEPTGLPRDDLLRRGYIEAIKDEPPPEKQKRPYRKRDTAEALGDAHGDGA